ncbi:MAG: aminotransferase class I/II-fold pyridoxal phosphate-dependent enzyme, partial [bacterium]
MQFDHLKNAGLYDILSGEARAIILPQGIFHWSGRAKKEAKIDATIGSAQGKKSLFLPGGDDSTCTFYLPSVIKRMNSLDPEQIVPYAPINGLPKFRSAWRDWTVRKLSPHYSFDPECIGNPITVPGVTAALSYLARLFLSPGETILCHDRKWENYNLVFSGAQGLVVRSATLFSDGGLDVASFADAVRDIAKTQNPVAVVNFPNNPTGYMPSIAEGEKLRDELAKVADETGRKIVLIFDDAYDGFVYDPAAAPISIFGLFAGAHPGIVPIKCDGASKEFLLYG